MVVFGVFKRRVGARAGGRHTSCTSLVYTHTCNAQRLLWASGRGAYLVKSIFGQNTCAVLVMVHVRVATEPINLCRSTRGHGHTVQMRHVQALSACCSDCRPALHPPFRAQTERRRAPDVVLGQGDRQHRQADDEGNVRVETVLELVPAQWSRVCRDLRIHQDLQTHHPPSDSPSLPSSLRLSLLPTPLVPPDTKQTRGYQTDEAVVTNPYKRCSVRTPANSLP